MPFAQLTPRPFTSAFIRMHAPASPGVYGISNAREWIFIGATENIQDALLTHLADTQTALMRQTPTGFVFEICDGARRPARETRLVSEYNPLCNRRVSRYSEERS